MLASREPKLSVCRRLLARALFEGLAAEKDIMRLLMSVLKRLRWGMEEPSKKQKDKLPRS